MDADACVRAMRFHCQPCAAARGFPLPPIHTETVPSAEGLLQWWPMRRFTQSQHASRAGNGGVRGCHHEQSSVFKGGHRVWLHGKVWYDKASTNVLSMICWFAPDDHWRMDGLSRWCASGLGLGACCLGHALISESMGTFDFTGSESREVKFLDRSAASDGAGVCFQESTCPSIKNESMGREDDQIPL